MYPEIISWLNAQKFGEMKFPSETELINLLKSGVTFQIKCTHTDLDGNDSMSSTLVGTQKRSNCWS